MTAMPIAGATSHETTEWQALDWRAMTRTVVFLSNLSLCSFCFGCHSDPFFLLWTLSLCFFSLRLLLRALIPCGCGGAPES